VQADYNQAHGIVPRSTTRGVSPLENEKRQAERTPTRKGAKPTVAELPVGMSEIRDVDLLPGEIDARLLELRREMAALAKDLRYEEAAQVRDRIRVLEARRLEYA